MPPVIPDRAAHPFRWGTFAALVLTTAGATGVHAAEVATLENATATNIELYLQWSDRPYGSGKIVLAPGERRTFWAADGASLTLWFNSTPGMVQPPRERRVRVVTLRAPVPDNQVGYLSYFRPTPLPGGIVDWLATFGGPLLQRLTPERRAAIAHAIEARLAPTHRGADGVWVADYVRLRFIARRG